MTPRLELYVVENLVSGLTPRAANTEFTLESAIYLLFPKHLFILLIALNVPGAIFIIHIFKCTKPSRRPRRITLQTIYSRPSISLIDPSTLTRSTGSLTVKL
ncbi:hypothetical protein LENED_006542 [Lentinula edodes]|uniref:Uncharacterized protein n=1 Tax=Lentinula edodes TaxID=5353 RepID=A0A1Q3EBY6_LENED|nr:hypothetical protein LENED_006542 [Lentinula edodes]